MKVLYVAGYGRSGSTILGNVLGAIDGFYHAGELRSFWDHGLVDDVTCGCGTKFSGCSLWTEAVRSLDGMDLVSLKRMRDETNSQRNRGRLMTGRGRALVEREYAPLIQALSRLYASLQEQTGCRVLIDSTKLPSYGYLLGMLPGVQLYTLHLIRDPRAVAFSWQRKRARVDLGAGRYMMRMSPLKCAFWWSFQNFTAARLCSLDRSRSVRVRYEDFIARPREVVEETLRMLGEEGGPLPFVTETSVRMTAQHTLAGNPTRFNHGVVELKADDEWTASMAASDRAIVSAVTWPLRIGYAGIATAPRKTAALARGD